MKKARGEAPGRKERIQRLSRLLLRRGAAQRTDVSQIFARFPPSFFPLPIYLALSGERRNNFISNYSRRVFLAGIPEGPFLRGGSPRMFLQSGSYPRWKTGNGSSAGETAIQAAARLGEILPERELKVGRAKRTREILYFISFSFFLSRTRCDARAPRLRGATASFLAGLGNRATRLLLTSNRLTVAISFSLLFFFYLSTPVREIQFYYDGCTSEN